MLYLGSPLKGQAVRSYSSLVPRCGVTASILTAADSIKKNELKILKLEISFVS
jgi:hypothetical protein